MMVKPVFVGLTNYRELLLKETFFLNAIKNSVIWSVTVVMVTTIVAFAMALMLNQPLRGRRLIRTAILLPWVTPAITAATIWRLILNDRYGFLNYVLVQVLGLEEFTNFGWLIDTRFSLFSAILVQIWKVFPFFTLAFLSGLQAIPKDHYEAAEIEGASGFAKLRFVTLPGVRTTFSILVLPERSMDLQGLCNRLHHDQRRSLPQLRGDRGIRLATDHFPGPARARQRYRCDHLCHAPGVRSILHGIPQGQGGDMIHGTRTRSVLLHTAVAAILVVVLFPVFWMLVNSVKPMSEIFSQVPRVFSSPLTLENYQKVLALRNFPRNVFNSVIVAVATSFIAVVVALLAAYAVIRYDFPGKAAYLLFLLILQMIPGVVLIAPLLRVVRVLRLYDTYRVIVLLQVGFWTPVGIWLLIGFLKESSPRELHESAMIDGATTLQILARIVLPLSKPGLVTVYLFIFKLS